MLRSSAFPDKTVVLISGISLLAFLVVVIFLIVTRRRRQRLKRNAAADAVRYGTQLLLYTVRVCRKTTAFSYRRQVKHLLDVCRSGCVFVRTSVTS